MNTPQKKTYILFGGKFISPRRLFLGVFLFLVGGRLQAQEEINHIYTDYLGFWSSGVGKISSIKPDYSHNLLGFSIGGTTYSTGVNDAILHSYGVTFQAGNYQALPVVNIAITSGGDRYAMFGEMQDGLHNSVLGGGSMPFPYPKAVSLYDMLTDGIQGLDISTGVTNMRDKDGKPVEMKFPTLIENKEKIGDGIPDILVTQTAQPNSTIDEIWFTDDQGKMVEGSKVVRINQQQLKPLGKTMSDFYDPVTGRVGAGFINSERDLRISAYEISEFGITATNYRQARRLVYKMGGSSDPAFVAFNTELIKILVANNDMAQTDINTPVKIKVLQNDHLPAPEDLRIDLDPENLPSFGTVEIDPKTGLAKYTPTDEFTGVDNFKYRISDSQTSDVAMVTVVVGAADLVVSKEMSNEVPEKGDALEFRVRVRNDGPYDALAVRLNDLLPEGYTYKNHQVSAGSYSPLTGIWFVGTLSAEETAKNNSAHLKINVTVNEKGPYTNTAIGESVNYDPNLDNNTASVTPGTLPSASLRVDCIKGSEFKQVSISLTGEKPWELIYSFNDKEVTLSDIQTSPLKLDMENRGSFYLKSVQDRYGNKIDYEITPNSRKFVNPCFIVSNPMMPSKDYSK